MPGSLRPQLAAELRADKIYLLAPRVTVHRGFPLPEPVRVQLGAILLGMPAVHLDLAQLPLAVLTPPLVVWAWGHALAQLGTGIERLREALRDPNEDRPR